MLETFYRTVARIRAVFRSSELDRELDAELEAHVDLLAEEHVRRGASPEEARRLARIALGGAAELREAHRDVRGVPALDALAQDCRYSLRSLRHDAGFTAFTVLILALGIGACVTVFSVVDLLLISPLPFADSTKLVWIANRADDGIAEWSLQCGHVVDLRAQNTSFVDVAGYLSAFSPGDSKLTRNGEAERLSSLRVTQNFFSVFEVTPPLGRTFSAEDCGWKAPGTVVLSDEAWRRRFGADPNVVGTVVTLNDHPATVIGVAPPTFDFGDVFYPGNHVDVFLPLPLAPEMNNFGNLYGVIGRLKPGVTVESARAEVTAIAERLTKEHPERNGFRAVVASLVDHVTGRLRSALLVLAWSVVLVLLIVWANVGSLQMARSVARRKETAVRAAIGAGRWRLARQTMTESMLLAGCGAAVGVGLAVAGTHALASLNVFNLPALSTVHVGGRGLVFAAVVALLTGVLFGVAPALQAYALPVQSALKDAGRGSAGSKRHTRIRGVLVVSEIALACVLLVGAGLLVRSFVNVLDLNLNFRPEQAAALRVDPAAKYASLEQRSGYFDEVLASARAVPGVAGAGLADMLPLVDDRGWQVTAKGKVFPNGKYPEGFARMISEGYLEAMGIPLLEGRGFTEQDTVTSEPVVIINETLARTLWPGQDAVGQILIADGMNDQEHGRRVVGVVADVHHRALELEPGCEFYSPIRQTKNYGSVYLVIRSAQAPGDLAVSIRAALHPVAAETSAAELFTMQGTLDRTVAPRRFVVILLVGFAIFALMLAALGVYAVISYSVNQRTQEVGIRMALGARPGDVLRLVVGQGALLVVAGIAAGLAAATVLSRVLESLLFGVTTTDPLVYASGVGLLAAVALAACAVPARRAARVDPLVALRHD